MDNILYTVNNGDTLWGIAQYFGTTVNDLARYNGLAFPNEIYVGQILKIPTNITQTPQYYAIRPGDTLWTICNRYGLELNALIALNNLIDPNVLYPGQIIRLS